MSIRKASLAAGALCSVFALSAAQAFAEPATLTGKVTDVFGRRVALDTKDGKVLVNLGPRAVSQVAVKIGDTLTVEGDLRRGDEMRARRVSTRDGKLYEVNKPKTWSEWLLGKEPATTTSYAPGDAKKIAEGKGYSLTSDLKPERSHFVANATKDGKPFEIEIHRDGRIVADREWTAVQARDLALQKGYVLVGQPSQEMKHFTASATKDGKSYEVDLHRDGRVVYRPMIDAATARAVAIEKGYVVVSDPQRTKRHYEVLATKGGTFYEIHVNGDRSLRQARAVTKADPKWGSRIN